MTPSVQQRQTPSSAYGQLSLTITCMTTCVTDGLTSLQNHSHQPGDCNTWARLPITLTSRPSKCTISGMADTGCQSCLCGLPVMNKQGISEKNLIPVTMLIHAANKASIKILGAAIIRLSGRAKPGKHVETRQILYVTDNADKLFISRKACISLAMIIKNFPSIGEAASLSSKEAICDCPRRILPPPRPTNPSCPPTEEIIPRIKQHLMDYYCSSTFNTCKHQPLTLMEGPPMKLMIE